MKKQTSLPNPADYDLHFAAIMAAAGFTDHEHHEMRCGDDGGPENGPHFWCDPASTSWTRIGEEVVLFVSVSWEEQGIDVESMSRQFYDYMAEQAEQFGGQDEHIMGVWR